MLYRLDVAARVLLAAAGGYALAATTAALLAIVLPLARSEAVVTATMLSFLVMAVAVLYVFAARTFKAAAVGILLPLAAGGGCLWLVLRLLDSSKAA